MSDESMNSLQDLLDQHSYDMPQAGDIRTGVIVAITPQGLIIDLGLKRDGIVPVSYTHLRLYRSSLQSRQELFRL